MIEYKILKVNLIVFSTYIFFYLLHNDFDTIFKNHKIIQFKNDTLW